MSDANETPKENQVRILQSIKDTELDLKIILMQRSFKIGEITALSPGSVLMFESPINSPAKLTVNNKTFAEGTVVRVGDNYGLQLKELI